MNYTIVASDESIVIIETGSQTVVMTFDPNKFYEASVAWSALTSEAARMALEAVQATNTQAEEEDALSANLVSSEDDEVEVETAAMEAEEDQVRQQVTASLIQQGQMSRKDSTKGTILSKSEDVQSASEGVAGATVPASPITPSEDAPRKELKGRAASGAVGRFGDPRAMQQQQTIQIMRETGSYFKALGNGLWIATYTNCFEDKEREILLDKALDGFVERVDKGFVPMPELWTWHTAGSRHGEAFMLTKADKMVVAVGKFDNTPAAKAAESYYLAQPRGTITLSHGFTYPQWAKSVGDDGVATYSVVNTFEISTLPAGAEANPYTVFQVRKEQEMLTDAKRQYIKSAFGVQADTILAEIENVERSSKALVEAGVKFKDFTEPEAESAEATEKASATKASGMDGSALEILADLVQTNSTVADVALKAADAINILEARLKAVEALLETAPVPVEKAGRFLDVTSDNAKAATKAINAKTAHTSANPELADQVSAMFPGLISE